MKKDPIEHASRVLEYDRIRDVLASYAASALGREVAVRLRPLSNPGEIRRQLRQTEEMRELLQHARIPLTGSYDVVRELEKVKRYGRPAEPEQLYHVIDLLRVSQSLRKLLSTNSATPELAELATKLEDLPELRESIPRKIDPRDGVRDGASPKLAELRATIAELRNSLRQKAHAILSRPKLQSAFQGGGVTIKNDRYLVPVKAEYRSWISGPMRDRSHSGATLYIEPDELTAEGDRLIDYADQERGEVSRVLWEVTRQVLEVRTTLKRIQDGVAWIDFTYAKACYADAFSLNSPRIEDQKVLDLRDARHPYLMWLARDKRRDHREIDLEAIHSEVVPLSVRLGERYRVVVVTGPNTGGKTVALKTVGLNVLLALSGIPIAAAETSRVPFYDGVFADIGDEQSIEQSLSTFSSHLTQIIEVLKSAGERALILFDEMGAGTDPLEGAALGKAILDRCLERGWHTILTTHIGSLKTHAYVRDGVENAAMEFDEKSLRPTYRLLMGIPGSSMALAVARRMGLDDDVLDAAEAEVDREEEPSRELIRGMEKTRRRIEREKKKIETARRKAQGEVREFEERNQELVATRGSLHQEMEEEVDAVLRDAKGRLLPIVERLRNLPKIHQGVVEELIEAVEKCMVGTPLGKKREKFVRSLKKGDEVYVPKFRDRATVRKIDKGGRLLTVLLNGLSLEISFDDVSWIEPPIASEETSR